MRFGYSLFRYFLYSNISKMSKSISKSPPGPGGYVHPSFQHVLDVFRDSFLNGKDKGSSFAAYYKGELVVSICGGFADEKAKRPWREDTLGYFHSCSKFVTAVCVARLVERGLLDYDEKVSRYWPEFNQNGKDDITLSTLLSHQAGLAALDENFELAIMRDKPHELAKLLSRQKPLWEPGKHHGYSPIVTGLYIDELIKRVDPKGRNTSKFFEEEIALSFGIDFHIGMPKPLQYRAARLEPQGNLRDVFMKRMDNFQGNIEVLRLTTVQPNDWNSRWKLNDPDFAILPCPSSHGVGTARGAAKFAGIIANGGLYEDKILLSPKSIEKLQKPLAKGPDVTLSESVIYGPGTMMIPVGAGKQTWFLFGHAGYGGQNLVSDSKFKLGWAYVSNYIDPLTSFDNNRWKPLVDALYRCIFQLEGISEQFEMFESYEEHMKKASMRNKL